MWFGHWCLTKIVVNWFQVGRWSFLALGILYGINRQSRLSKKEAKLREIREKERPAKEAAMAAEKAKATRGTKFCY